MGRPFVVRPRPRPEIRRPGRTPVTVRPFLIGDLGRLRDVVARDRLWLLTDNTDGRGSPRSGDDRLVEVPLVPAQNTRQPE